MAPLPSGRYSITNARYNNVATLLNGDRDTDVISGAQNDTLDALWDIVQHVNQRYTIKNCNHGSFVNREPNPEQGESVFGGNYTNQQWKIKEMRMKGQYVIYPTDALVYWGLSDGEIKTPIQFSSAANDPKNQWIFNKVPGKVSSGDDNQPGAVNDSKDQLISNKVPDNLSSEDGNLPGDAGREEDWIVNPSDVEFGQKIGEGGFGAVYEGTWHKKSVALKVLTNDVGIYPISSTIRREIKIWSSLRHPHILLFLGANVSDKSPFIVMPLMINGNARDYIDCNPECNRHKILHDISLGLVYLHGRDVVHGDLKSFNVLIDHGGSGVLCDFGLSRIKADVASRTVKPTMPTETTGSRNWMSPERLMGSSPKKPSDIYAFGMVIYEIHTNEIPLGHVEPSRFIELVVDRNLQPERPENDEAPQMTDESWRLAEDCWKRDPTSRPNIDSVCHRISRIADNFSVQRLTKLPTLAIESPNSEKPSLSPPVPLQPAPAPAVKPFSPELLPPLPVAHPAPRTFRKTCIFKGHTSTVLSVSFSPEGERVVSGSSDKSVLVWDVKTQKVILGPLRGHTYDVRSAAYSPDGEQIVSGSSDRSVIVWNAQNGNLFKKLTKHTDVDGNVHSVAYNPDGNMIASGSGNKTIQFWDSVTGENIRSLKCEEYIQTLTFSSNGQYLVSGTGVGVDVWEVDSWERVRRIGDSWVLAVAVSPDSRNVAYSHYHDICVADVKTGEVIMELRGHGGTVRSLAISPDGTWIASGSDDKTIRIWDTSTGNSILTLETGSMIHPLAISPDGTQIVAGCRDSIIHLFSCDSVV